MVVVLCGTASVHAAGSDADVATTTSLASDISHIKTAIAALKSRKDIADDRRQHAIETYQQAISALDSAQADRKQTEELRQAEQDAPAATDKAQAQLRALEQAPPADAMQDMSIEQLSARALSLNSALSDAQAELSNLRDSLTQAAQRPDQIRQSLSDARTSLQALAAPSGGDSAAAQSESQRALAAARRETINARIERLQQELSGQDASERLLEARRSLAEARVAHDNEALAAVQSALGEQQNASAQALKNASESKLNELRSAPAPISQAAQRNVELTHQLSTVAANAETLAARQVAERERVEDIERRFNLVQRQLEIGGGSVALGDVLRAQRRKLASPTLGFLSVVDTTTDVPDLASSELQRFQLQQDRADLDSPVQSADMLASKAEVHLNPGQEQSLVALLQQRRSILDLLIDSESRYIDMGRDMQALSQQYSDTLSSFNRLLDERLFWLPSFAPIQWDWPARVAAGVSWIVDPRSWQDAIVSFLRGVIARPFVAGVGVLFVAVLIGMRRPLRRRMRLLGEPIGNVSNDSFWLTSRVAVITILLSLPSVLIPLLVSYFMRHAPAATPFTKAAAAGVFQLGMLWLFIEPYANVCRAHGLADRHFQWLPAARRGLHRNLRWLLAAMIIPVVVISMTEAFDDDSKRETLGRAAFIVGELAIALFSWRLLHPTRGVLSDVLGGADNRHWRLGYLYLPFAAGVPLVLLGLSAIGYYYTALQLQSRFFYSAALLGACMILYSLIVRWVTIAERRLALARALRKREEAREARASREAAAVSGDSTPDTLDALEIDLVQISEQTRGLIKMVITLVIAAGLWMVWAGTLPALTLLNNIDLWQHVIQVNGKAEITSVTLGAALLAIAVGVVTALAGRNLPGFLEITLLRRFSLDSGSRYAVATLFQYTIVIAGLLVSVNLIGLRWSSIQWLVAALGVGLGFGLQEIFANFISGIVILFERPVRVGDTVTVGTLTGTVSRIRIRATTITDWDNKEVVIPNKTFITGTVVNWTLTDDITRLVLKVGVGYDSDSDLVEKLIMQSVHAEPVALSTPAPSVFMVGYGDSALLYEVRVFYHELYNLLPLQHALYRRIRKAFAENGVEIVFPQTDLHLRSVDESFARMFGRGKEDDSTKQEQESSASTRSQLKPSADESG